MFHVGQKVVCVDDYPRVNMKRRGWFSRFRRFNRLDHNLNKDDVYTVIATGRLVDDTTGEVFESLFVDKAWHFGHPEVGFPSFQFRPVVEQKTDIGFAHEILRKVSRSNPVKVRA